MATLGWALIQLLWQGVVLAGIFALALWVFRRASSRVRYGLGATALVALLALPFLSLHAYHAGYSVPDWSGGPIGGLASRAGAQLPTVATLWTLGCAVSLFRLGGGVWLTRRFAAESTPFPPTLLAEAQEMARGMGVQRVRFGLCERLESPGTVGCLDPVVLLPNCAIDLLQPVELRAVLAHELAHVRRRDALANLIQALTESIFFFHPAVWWISSCVRMEREHCCDDMATLAIADGRALARALSRLESRAAPPRLAVAGTGGLLVARVRRLLGGVGRPWAPAGPGLRAALLLAALSGALLAPAAPPAPQLAENAADRAMDEDDSPFLRIKVLVLRLHRPAEEPTGELPIGFDPWPNMMRVARWVLRPAGIV